MEDKYKQIRRKWLQSDKRHHFDTAHSHKSQSTPDTAAPYTEQYTYICIRWLAVYKYRRFDTATKSRNRFEYYNIVRCIPVGIDRRMSIREYSCMFLCYTADSGRSRRRSSSPIRDSRTGICRDIGSQTRRILRRFCTDQTDKRRFGSSNRSLGIPVNIDMCIG